MSHDRTRAVALAVAMAATSATAYANDLFWQGGTADLGIANYFDGTTLTPNVAPAAADYVFIGADGTATYSTPSTTLALGRIRLGHLSTAGTTAAPAGSGSLAISAGAVTAGGTTGGGISSGLIVGYNNSGSLSLTGTGTLTSAFFGKVGFADDLAATGTASVSISDTARLTISNRGLQIGEGLPGSVTITGTGTLRINNGTTGQLAVGVTTTGTFLQTGGSTVTGNNVFVGQNSTTDSSLTVSGGTFTANGGVNVGHGATSARSSVTITDNAVFTAEVINVGNTAGAADASITISGNANVTSTGAFIIANAATTNSSATIKGNSTVSTVGSLQVGLSADPNASLTVAENATINIGVAANATTDPSITAHLFVGRSTSTTTFNMTGGTINAPNLVLFGTSGGNPTSVTANHSAGTINAGTSATSTNRGFKLGDSGGTTNYNLSGTGTINVNNGPLIVGRQNSTATLNQTGGSVTASGGFAIGYAETTTAASQTGTGTYAVSGGSLAASVPVDSTANALAVGEQGTGTFRVIGDDATINVNGNVLVNALPAEDPTPARVGTLAYQLEAGDAGLSMISSTGVATFAAGSVLELDFNSLTPSATSFNLLTAVDIIDNGLTFNAPAGWSFEIVAGGNGELLRALTAVVSLPGDYNNDGFVGQDDLNLVLGNWGQTVTPGKANGDGSGDGFVGQDDLNQILGSWGQGGAAATAALTAVPEPGTLSLVGLGALATLARRRRQA